MQNSIFLESSNEEEILNILNCLNTKKGAGIDGIRPKDIKNNAKVLTPIITKLINPSLDSAQIPEDLKTSVIRPVYKNGKRSDYNNYRPISILPVVEKILEEIVARRLNNFLKKNKIINKNQFGFQKEKSINSLLGNFANHINNCLSKKMHCLVLFIDFSKAFDTLSHNKLLQIMERSGIRGNTLQWFKQYLNCRTYRVKINNVLSDKIVTDFGVPQGSKLGPILYILYANDMLNALQGNTTYAYADDTAIVVSDENINNAIETMQSQLNTTTRWCHDNGLIINAQKTKIMHIKPPHFADINVNIKFHDTKCLHNTNINNDDTCTTQIELVTLYKYLGVYVDNRFKWNAHVDYLQKKLRTSAFMLYHLSNCATYSVLRQAYYSIAESYLRHGITAWGNATHCRLLQNTQDRLLKILYKNQHYHQTYINRNHMINSQIHSNHTNNNFNYNTLNTSNNNNSNYNTNNNNNDIRHNISVSNITIDNYNSSNVSTSNNTQNGICNYTSNNIGNSNNTINGNNTIQNKARHNISNGNISHNSSYIVNTRYNNNISNNNESNNIRGHNTINNSIRLDTRNYTNPTGSNFIAKALHMLNIKGIYYTTLAAEFHNDSRFLQRIDHQYNTRRRKQGRFKIEKFDNNYGRGTLNVMLPKIFNMLPVHILQIHNKHKRKKLIKKFFMSSQ